MIATTLALGLAASACWGSIVNPADTESASISAAAPAVDCTDPALDENVWMENCTPAVEEGEYPGGGSLDELDADAVDAELRHDGGRLVHPLPDGLRGEIVEVTGTAQSPELVSEPGFDSEVRVTVRLTNTGAETVPLLANGTYAYGDELLYGANHYSATNYFNMDGGSAEDAPAQLVSGSTVDITSVYQLPGSKLGELALQFTPGSDAYTKYTFTDVETLLQ